MSQVFIEKYITMGFFNFHNTYWGFGKKPDTKRVARNVSFEEKKELKKLNLKDIIKVDFPDNQYYRTQTTKNQIVLHHTVSGQGVDGDINWWLSTTSRIATHVIVDWEGKIYQCYSSKYWGHHLGSKTSNNKALNKASIGIEIDAWGGLVEKDNRWYPAKWDKTLKKFIPNTRAREVKNVTKYPNKFRGFYGFETYTQEQIEVVRQLLVYWGKTYKIPLDYHEDMWDISSNALKGDSGIWTHVSYRKNKSDCHPQPELIKMFKSLK